MSLPETIAALRKLNQPVPRPLRLPTEAEVLAAQNALRVQFPADYRHYLLHASDVVYGALEPATVVPNGGHRDLIIMVEDAWQIGVPRDLLPFCEDNGDYYCLTQDGQVRFFSHNGASSDTWPDLAHWIQQVWIAQG